MLKNINNYIVLLIFGLIMANFFPLNDVFAATCKSSGILGVKEPPIDSNNFLAENILKNISKLNKAVDAKVSSFLVLGSAINCAATHFMGTEINIVTVTFTVPDFSLLLSGIVIWILGIILVMIVGFYLVDISFKLGFAIISMPIAMALWPFKITSKYLGVIISLMFNCAGTFIFLSLGAAYAITLFAAAVAPKSAGADSIQTSGNQDTMEAIYEILNKNHTKEITDHFDFVSIQFMLLVFAGIYGFRLIGKLVNDYTSNFFSSDIGKGTPMHSGLTQITDFAKQQAGKVGSYVKDVAKTQGGRAFAKAGGKISGAMSTIGKGMQKAGGPAKVLGKMMEGMGNTGQKMAKNHETRYQNQGKKMDVKDGELQPKQGDQKGNNKAENNESNAEKNSSGNKTEGGEE